MVNGLVEIYVIMRHSFDAMIDMASPSTQLRSMLVYEDVQDLKSTQDETLFVCRDNFGTIDSFRVSCQKKHVCLFQYTTKTKHGTARRIRL